MSRFVAIALAVALVAASCGGGAVPSTGPSTSQNLAPNFTLTLADGTVFTLADESRPVYLVFWAEW
jgi:cytochrome oxidase Cu insertion factor (SCO1/SenC/PrrC family)